ncbi:MAG: hypothetical protein HKP34_00180 [Nitrosopumilus sp.]|nr:hypothetical protein [Nitrosopumilus sp.]NNL36707.1 hypothetical protein [Nitrosopumilus sp.]
MKIVLEIGTKNYDNDLLSIKKALSHLESLVNGYNGYTLSEPSSKFGWTFFKLAFKPDLQNGIEKKFADMIVKYQANYPAEKFAKFMTDYFASRNCEVKIKISD